MSETNAACAGQLSSPVARSLSSKSARMSSTRQTVVRGPSFRGLGKRPDFTPCHQVDLETGIGPTGASIWERRTNPVWGKLSRCIAVPHCPWLFDRHLGQGSVEMCDLTGGQSDQLNCLFLSYKFNSNRSAISHLSVSFSLRNLEPILRYFRIVSRDTERPKRSQTPSSSPGIGDRLLFGW